MGNTASAKRERTVDDGSTALHHAAEDNQPETLERLLKNGAIADINAVNWWDQTALHLAVVNENVACAQMLVKYNCNVDLQTKERWANTALQMAAARGHKQLVEILLDANANLDLGDDNESTALHCAILWKQPETMELLLKKGANVNAIDRLNRSAILLAAQFNYVDCFRVLMKYNCNVNVQGDYYHKTTALHAAAATGNKQIVEELLEANANMELVTKDGHTALYYAAQQNQPEIIELLLKKGARINTVNNKGQTPLHVAVFKRHETCVQLLIKHNCELALQDINEWFSKTALPVVIDQGHMLIVEALLLKTDANVLLGELGNTPLHYAVGSNQPEIMELLLKKDANIDAVNQKGQTALHMAVFKKHMDCVRILIKYNCDLNVQPTTESWLTLVFSMFTHNGPRAYWKALLALRDANGNSTLHYAAQGQQPEILELLLNKGANVNAINHAGRTALHVAIDNDAVVCVVVFIKYNCDVNKQMSGEDSLKTALHVATEKGQRAIVEFLLEASANLELKDSFGNTALNYTARCNQPEILELLLKKGANVNDIHKDGETALHTAIVQQHLTCVQILIKYNCDVNVQDIVGDTALHKAIEIVDCLLGVENINFSVCNEKGFNILHHAAFNGNHLIVQHLLTKTLHLLNMKTKDWFTAEDIAVSNGHPAVALLLQEQMPSDAETRVPPAIHENDLSSHLVSQQIKEEVIGQKIGAEWRRLGGLLNVPEHLLESSDISECRVQEKAVAMLTQWQEMNGEKATLGILTESLRLLERNDLVADILTLSKESSN